LVFQGFSFGTAVEPLGTTRITRESTRITGEDEGLHVDNRTAMYGID
jgi:hypothetical protein